MWKVYLILLVQGFPHYPTCRINLNPLLHDNANKKTPLTSQPLVNRVVCRNHLRQYLVQFALVFTHIESSVAFKGIFPHTYPYVLVTNKPYGQALISAFRP